MYHHFSESYFACQFVTASLLALRVDFGLKALHLPVFMPVLRSIFLAAPLICQYKESSSSSSYYQYTFFTPPAPLVIYVCLPCSCFLLCLLQYCYWSIMPLCPLLKYCPWSFHVLYYSTATEAFESFTTLLLLDLSCPLLQHCY